MNILLATLMAKTPLETEEMVLVLEKMSGHPGIDVRLGIEINRLATEQLDSLDLDPEDTTAQELYQAILARFGADEEKFTRSLGARQGHKHEQFVPLLVDKLSAVSGPHDTWALKRSVARELLAANPPKNLMKHLGYRTVDSMLKREGVEELFAAAPFVEKSQWSGAMAKLYKRLKPTDFESRPVVVIPMSSVRWSGLPRQGSVVGFVPQLGAVVVWPAPSSKSYGLALAVLILEAVQNTRVVGSWLEYHQVEQSFGQALASILEGNALPPLEIGSQSVEWRSIALYAAKAPELHSLISGRVKKPDLDIVLPEVELARLEPSLRWWAPLRHVGKIIDGRTISFNIADVAINHANHRPLDMSSTNWLANAVGDELIGRYMRSSWVEDTLLGQLKTVKASR